jgi:predicted nucleic acid-binding protein
MKVFVDANILVATLNKEYPLFTWSSRILSLNEKSNVLLYTSPLCLAIAFYLSGKKCGAKMAKQKIEILCNHINVTSMDEEATKKALTNKMIHDFEDGLEYYSALDSNCDFIITEDQKDFYFSEIEVVGCEEFLKRLTPQT